jgi:hypothetical protein
VEEKGAYKRYQSGLSCVGSACHPCLHESKANRSTLNHARPIHGRVCRIFINKIFCTELSPEHTLVFKQCLSALPSTAYAAKVQGVPTKPSSAVSLSISLRREDRMSRMKPKLLLGSSSSFKACTCSSVRMGSALRQQPRSTFTQQPC